MAGTYGGGGRVARRSFDLLALAAGAALRAPIVLISHIGEAGLRVVGAHGVQEPGAGTALCRQVARTGRPVIVHDARRRPALVAGEQSDVPVVGYAAMPVMLRDNVVGVIAAASHDVRSWSGDDVDLLRRFADAVAEVLPRQLPSVIELALDRERRLSELLIQTVGARSTVAALAALVEDTQWSCADVVVMIDRRLEVVASHAAQPRHDAWSPAGSWDAESDPLIRQALADGELVWQTDLGAQHGSVRAAAAARAGFAVACAVAIPGRSAVVELFTTERDPDRARLTRLAPAFAALIAPTLERERPEEIIDRRTGELEILALHDELTGLLNRRGFYAVASGQLALARRRGLPGMLLFVDVDGLKACNDDDGHAAGDDLLRVAATVLRSTFRQADTIGRVGGDEFVVLSIDAAPQELDGLVRRLDAELRRANDDRVDRMPLSWSVGHAGFEAASAVSLDALIVDADRRMYDVKRAARVRPS